MLGGQLSVSLAGMGRGSESEAFDPAKLSGFKTLREMADAGPVERWPHEPPAPDAGPEPESSTPSPTGPRPTRSDAAAHDEDEDEDEPS